MANNLFLYFIVFIGIFLSSIAGLYSISGLVIIFKGNIIATTLMAIALEISKVCISIYIHIYWKKANRFLISYLGFALIVLMMITSAGVYSYLSKSYMTSTDTDVIYEKIKLIESQIDIEKEKIKNKQDEIKSLRNYPTENRDNSYYWKINAINAKITEYTTNVEKMTDSLTPLRNKVLEINMEIGPLKYISLLLYQSDGKVAIDKSVQVFIGIVVMVFDPLAILLIFSGIHGLHKRKIDLENLQKEIEEKREKEKDKRLQTKLEKEKRNKQENNDYFKKIIENNISDKTLTDLEEKIKGIDEIKKTLKEIVPSSVVEEETMPTIPPPEEENKTKKVLKIKKKKEKPFIDEKEIIPPLIKNRPNRPKKIKKNKKEKMIEIEVSSPKVVQKTEIIQMPKKNIDKKENNKKIIEEKMMEERIKEQQIDKERAIDFLYNGERQEDYLIKYKNRKKKVNDNN